MTATDLRPTREAKSGPEVPLGDDLPGISEDSGEDSGKGRIRCPKCGWEPRSEDLWMCRCGCSWHTFDTGGRCPDCGRQWHETECFLCGEWSPHEEWYA